MICFLKPILFTVLAVFCFANESFAKLKLGSPFGDHMVLQHDQPVKIWGWAQAGESVSVTIKDQTTTAIAGDDGKWKMQMAAPGLGEPFSVKIAGAAESIQLADVVGGEVWVCGGQSNMEWYVKNSKDADAEIAAARYPMIRLFNTPHRTSLVPNDEVGNSGWRVCSPKTVGDFTAVGYYFARELHRELDIPVGLVSSNWGGTIIEAWISGSSLKTHADFKARVEEMEQVGEDPQHDKTLAMKVDAWMKNYRKMQRVPAETWQSAALDDSGWGQQKLPGHWERQGHKGVDGVAWYRRKVAVPQQWKGKALKLSLGLIDDADVTYVNGSKVGETGMWDTKRLYDVSADLAGTDELSIAVKVTDGNLNGGIVGDAKDLSIGPVGETPVSLAGLWKFRLEPATEKLGPRPQGNGSGPNRPMILHNAMIHPLVPLAVRGTIWYQGESNSDRGRQYRTLMPLLIEDWRRKWENEMSFYWVQLANYRAAKKTPYDSQWAELREAQSMTLSVPKTGQAVIIDIGEARDIHPKNKQDVGRRLALIALAKDYDKNVKYSGPMYKSMAVEGDKVRLQFEFAQGLAIASGERLERFELCGADRKFYRADAMIDGQAVVVSCNAVKSPVAVRYAWADNPAGCNLTNETGLPASPFRTDDWQRRE